MSFRKMVEKKEEVKIENVELIGNNLLVEIELPKEKTKEGIYLDETSKKELQKDIIGTVRSVGKGVEFFNVGDEILIPPYGSTPVRINGDVYHVFKESSLFGRVKR